MRMKTLLAAAAAVLMAAPVSAKCELPTDIAGSANAAARYLYAGADLVVEGTVRELPRGDGTLFQRIEVERYIKGEATPMIDIWPGPRRPDTHQIISKNWGRIEAEDGAKVVAAIKETPFGWTIGECVSEALAVPGASDALRDGSWREESK